MADIDNLTIEISAVANTAIDALNNLAQALKTVNAELDRIDPSRLKSVASAADEVNQKCSGFSDSAKSIKELSSQLNNVNQNVGNVANVGNAAQNVSEKIGQASSKLKEMTRALNETSSAAGSGGGFSTFVQGVKSLGNAIGSANSHLALLGKTAKFVFKTIASPAILAARAVKSLGKANDATAKTARTLAKELTRVSKMLKLMVTRMALRAVIKEVGNGFKSLALHSEEFNQSVSNLMNGSKKLGYSFASMLSPLINALAPAIEYVINLLTKLLNIMNQIFSVFAGKTTYNKSKDFSENWKDNIEAANKNAKELKKTVLGFDELNQLQEKTTSGGDTSGNITDMFETVDIDPKWKEFADWLKDMWKMGDFTDLGKMLGEKLRDMLEAIPWDLIKSTANKLGGALATLINGFVEVERLGYDIGKTIAESVNTVFEFLNGFVHKIHWDSIGKFIAETFNGFFENIDWPLIKDTVVTGMAGLAEAIQTFIEEFHWDNISQTIINGMDVIASGVLAFVDGIDWLEFGKKVGEQIKKSLEGIDWYQVGEAMGAVIQAAVDWVAGMIESMPSVETLIKKATELMHGLFDRVDFEQMGANLGKIMQSVYDFLTGFWDENGEEIKNKVKEFFKGFWDNIDKSDLSKVIGVIIGGAIVSGIASAGWKLLGIVLSEKIKAMVAGAAASPEAAAAASSAGASVATAFVAGIVTFFAGAELGKYIGKNIFPDDAELYEGYSGIMGTLMMVIDTVVAAYDLWVMKAEEAWENIKTCCSLLGAAFSALSSLVKSSIKEMVEKFTEFKKNAEDGLKELATNIGNKINEAKEFISGFAKDIAKAFSKDSWTFSGVAEGLKETFQKAKDGIKGIWNSIAEKLNGEFEVAGKTIKIDLPTFAYGGFPEDGLFMANHGEMVGRFSNGKTAVANNAQIVEGISAGVYNAVTSAMSNSNSGSEYIANTIIVDGEVIARTVTKAQQRQNRRYSPAY